MSNKWIVSFQRERIETTEFKVIAENEIEAKAIATRTILEAASRNTLKWLPTEITQNLKGTDVIELLIDKPAMKLNTERKSDQFFPTPFGFETTEALSNYRKFEHKDGRVLELLDIGTSDQRWALTKEGRCVFQGQIENLEEGKKILNIP